MPITGSDLEFRFSAPSASGGNQFDQDDPAASLGKYLSKTVWTGGVLHDLFQALSGDDNAAGVQDFRCLFLVNKHTTLTWTAPVVWFSADTQVGGAEIAVAIDPTVSTAINAEVQQARVVNGP